MSQNVTSQIRKQYKAIGLGWKKTAGTSNCITDLLNPEIVKPWKVERFLYLTKLYKIDNSFVVPRYLKPVVICHWNEQTRDTDMCRKRFFQLFCSQM